MQNVLFWEHSDSDGNAHFLTINTSNVIDNFIAAYDGTGTLVPYVFETLVETGSTPPELPFSSYAYATLGSKTLNESQKKVYWLVGSSSYNEFPFDALPVFTGAGWVDHGATDPSRS